MTAKTWVAQLRANKDPPHIRLSLLLILVVLSCQCVGGVCGVDTLKPYMISDVARLEWSLGIYSS